MEEEGNDTPRKNWDGTEARFAKARKNWKAGLVELMPFPPVGGSQLKNIYPIC